MNFLDKTGLQYFWGKIKNKIDSNIAANDAMTYKGTIGTSGTVTSLPASHKVGDTYKVITSGSYANLNCEIGDMIICVKTGSTSVNSDWTVVQSNIDGAVTGPTSSTDSHVAVFNGATGKIIKDSGFTIAKSVPSNAVFTDTTYSEATTQLAGLMSVADKIKLDGITGSGDYVLPAATGTTLGGVKIGSNITNSSGTISVTKLNVTDALGYTPLLTASDTKVTQNQIGSSNSEYPILYSYSANTTSETNTVNKSSIKFNPSNNSIIMSDGDIRMSNGQIVIDGDGSNTLSRTFITLAGDGGTTTINLGKITSPMFVKSEGTSSQLLVADGSVATAISTNDIDEICV